MNTSGNNQQSPFNHPIAFEQTANAPISQSNQPPTQQPAMPTAHTPRKPFSIKTISFIIATIGIGLSVPLTVLTINQGTDIRGRASEPTTIPQLNELKTTAPLTPAPQSLCNGACTSHADCGANYFCSDAGVCKNALCPQSADCICED